MITTHNIRGAFPHSQRSSSSLSEEHFASSKTDHVTARAVRGSIPCRRINSMVTKEHFLVLHSPCPRTMSLGVCIPGKQVANPRLSENDGHSHTGLTGKVNRVKRVKRHQSQYCFHRIRLFSKPIG